VVGADAAAHGVFTLRAGANAAAHGVFTLRAATNAAAHGAIHLYFGHFKPPKNRVVEKGLRNCCAGLDQPAQMANELVQIHSLDGHDCLGFFVVQLESAEAILQLAVQHSGLELVVQQSLCSDCVQF
jgi:hypothetical protein